MTMTRVRIEGGHTEITLAGVKYVPDETGAFEIPEQFASELIRSHGGKIDPGVTYFEENVKQKELELAALKNAVEVKTKEVSTAKDQLHAYKNLPKEQKPDPKLDQKPDPQRQQGGNPNQQGRR